MLTALFKHDKPECNSLFWLLWERKNPQISGYFFIRINCQRINFFKDFAVAVGAVFPEHLDYLRFCGFGEVLKIPFGLVETAGAFVTAAEYTFQVMDQKGDVQIRVFFFLSHDENSLFYMCNRFGTAFVRVPKYDRDYRYVDCWSQFQQLNWRILWFLKIFF